MPVKKINPPSGDTSKFHPISTTPPRYPLELQCCQRPCFHPSATYQSLAILAWQESQDITRSADQLDQPVAVEKRLTWWWFFTSRSHAHFTAKCLDLWISHNDICVHPSMSEKKHTYWPNLFTLYFIWLVFASRTGRTRLILTWIYRTGSGTYVSAICRDIPQEIGIDGKILGMVPFL